MATILARCARVSSTAAESRSASSASRGFPRLTSGSESTSSDGSAAIKSLIPSTGSARRSSHKNTSRSLMSEMAGSNWSIEVSEIVSSVRLSSPARSVFAIGLLPRSSSNSELCAAVESQSASKRVSRLPETSSCTRLSRVDRKLGSAVKSAVLSLLFASPRRNNFGMSANRPALTSSSLA